MAERSETKSAKRSFASKILKFIFFDAKLRFALLASLRKVAKKLVASFLLKMAESSEAKIAKRSFASKYFNFF